MRPCIRIFNDIIGKVSLTPLLAIVSLIYMHIRVVLLSGLPFPELRNFIINIISVGYDIAWIGLLATLICFRARKLPNLLISFFVLIWIYCNIIYATYFKTYIPLSAITQAESMESLNMWGYISGALQLQDFFPLFAILIGTCADWKRNFTIELTKSLSIYFGIIILLSLYFCTRKNFLPERGLLSAMPTETIYNAGTVRGQIMPSLFTTNSKSLSQEEISFIQDYKQKLDIEQQTFPSLFHDNISISNKKNLIFIITESYLARTAKAKLEGKDVTPYLDSLRTLPTTITNDSVIDNAGIGGSSDGQYIYMTGLLPLRDQITVTTALGKTVPSLPKALKDLGYETLMTNPSQPDMWQQQEMCPIYGIDTHRYCNSSRGYLWDNEIADYAISNEKDLHEPFYHCIITLSTHGSYNESHPEYDQCKCYPRQKPNGMSIEYFHYLQQCHFMDHAFRHYIESLKERKLYKNSIIVIASDHGWQENKTPLPNPKDGTRLSFLVLNAPVGLHYVRGPMNQLDVMTSVMDLMGINKSNGEWRGLGLSIFRPSKFHNSINADAWKVSADILRGNYFGNTSIKRGKNIH